MQEYQVIAENFGYISDEKVEREKRDEILRTQGSWMIFTSC